MGFGRQTRDIMIALCALIPPGSRSCATNGLMLNLPARLSTTLVEQIHMYLFSLHQAKLKKGELNRESMPNHQHMMKRTCLRVLLRFCFTHDILCQHHFCCKLYHPLFFSSFVDSHLYQIYLCVYGSIRTM